MKITFFVFIFLFVNFNCFSQINPPGFGKTNTSSWFALGMQQALDTVRRVESVTYIGMGRKSSPDEYNPYSKQAIWIFSQEFYHQFHPHWKYSLAINYCRQDQYSNRPPYEIDEPAIKQEFRIYSRLAYSLQVNPVKMDLTFRPEFRKYFAPDFTDLEEIFQLRARLRFRANLQLSKNKEHKLIGSAEVFFTTSQKQGTTKYMTNFAYTETRFCLYYSFAPRNLPLVFNIGYMNNLIGINNPHSTHCIALDIIIKNPFSCKNKKKA